MTSGAGSGAVLRVTAGRPTAEEVAALVAALDRSRPRGRPPDPAGGAVWARAARREALGGPPVATPNDLRGPG